MEYRPVRNEEEPSVDDESESMKSIQTVDFNEPDQPMKVCLALHFESSKLVENVCSEIVTENLNNFQIEESTKNCEVHDDNAIEDLSGSPVSIASLPAEPSKRSSMFKYVADTMVISFEAVKMCMFHFNEEPSGSMLEFRFVKALRTALEGNEKLLDSIHSHNKHVQLINVLSSVMLKREVFSKPHIKVEISLNFHTLPHFFADILADVETEMSNPLKLSTVLSASTNATDATEAVTV